MASRRRRSSKKRGRPPGRPKVQVGLRLPPEQKRDLKILRELLEGHPSIGGLIETAVERFVDEKLKDPRVRQAYDRVLNPRLSVVS